MSESKLDGHEELTSSLSQYLSKAAGKAVDVTALTRISDGWESDVYAFDAPGWREGGRVLRLYFGAEAGPKALHEYRALDLLGRAGYPVPQVDLVEPDTQALGRSFLIMQRVEGAPLGRRWRDPDPAVRQHATEIFCDLLTQLHSLQWKELPGAEKLPSFTVEEQLTYWSDFLKDYPTDAFQTAMHWLRDASTKVKNQPLGLVHWDFHHENILINERNRAWVIDWTQLQATDVRFDLGWTLILLASERDPAIAQEVRVGYGALRGWDAEASEREMEFFEAAACLKRLVSVLISLQQGPDSLGMRPGAESIMSGRLARFAVVYKRWLALTATPLSNFEELLAAHL
jgi:aminoglycoside phosphotransferase (APT) family kinase protein